MNKRILIVHPGSIVAEGLFQIIKNSPLQMHDHVRIIENPADINIQLNTNYIFICTNSLFHKIERLHLTQIQVPQNKHIQLIINDKSDVCNNRAASIHLDDSPNSVVDAIQSALNSFTDDRPLNSSLTDREIEILKWVALGNASKDIADRLNISTHTVVTHRKNITEKLGIKSISGLTVYAILNKIIDTNDLSIEDLI